MSHKKMLEINEFCHIDPKQVISLHACTKVSCERASGCLIILPSHALLVVSRFAGEYDETAESADAAAAMGEVSDASNSTFCAGVIFRP